MIYNKLLVTAIKAALRAGEAIMDVYNDKIDVIYKEDNSPLTIADKAANEIICSFLEPTEIPIISEENAATPYEKRKNWSECWIVDPLDGTKEFIKRNGEFTVNIALIKEGRPILGVVYVPAQKLLYFANVIIEEANKCELTSHNTSIAEIMVLAEKMSKKSISSNNLKIVGSRSHMNDETRKFVDELRSQYNEIEIIPRGSSLKFCLVAEGLADVYPRFAPTMEWDTAAAHAICKALGNSVFSIESNQELIYNKENLLNPWFICK